MKGKVSIQVVVEVVRERSSALTDDTCRKDSNGVRVRLEVRLGGDMRFQKRNLAIKMEVGCM